MPRMFMAGTVKPPHSPRPRARYKSWIEEGWTPTACPISQISQRASSRSSASPKTAVLASLSIAAEAMADSSWTVTRPSRTVTALLNGLANMVVEKLSGKREEGSGTGEQPNDYQLGAVCGAAEGCERRPHALPSSLFPQTLQRE